MQRPCTRFRWRPVAWCLWLGVLLVGAPPATALAQAVETLMRLPGPAGMARLLAPDRPAGALVVVLPDSLGADGRSEPYLAALLVRGIAVLELGLGEDPDGPEAGPVDPAASPEAVAPALAFARDAGVAPWRTGLLGFGRGGRAVLAAAGGAPAVALYPGCAGLVTMAGGAVLVLQGAEAPGAAACADVPQGGGADLILLPGAGHAWDAPGAIWPSPGPILPDPSGAGLLRARADLATTLAAAELAADWLSARLAPPSLAAKAMAR